MLPATPPTGGLLATSFPMATLYTLQTKNVQKTWALMAVFFAIVIAIGWAFSQVYNAPGVLYFAIIFSVAMNFFAYWYSDSIVIKLAGARPATREEFFDFYTVTENLSIAAGLPLPKLYVIEDPTPNAFATGRDKHHAVIAATTGLLSMMERAELEGVIAHELSHIGNRDILLSTVAVVLVGFITMLSDMFLRMGIYSRRNDDREGGGQMQGIIMIVGFVLAILAPIAATLTQLAISRRREYLADASGSLLTRYPEGLAKALEKIGAHEAPMRKRSGAIAHLYINDPNGGKKKRNWLNLLQTHPPIEERIRLLREMK